MDQFVGKLDKHFLVAYFVPSFFFIALNVGLEYLNLLPFGFLLQPLRDSKLELALVLTGAALFIGILLVALNRPVIQLYEGYPFQRFRFLTTRQRQKWYKNNDRLQQLREEYNTLQVYEDPKAVSLRDEITALRYERITRFPPEPSTVLPTRLGNTIRAFERHVWVRYGIEPITLWPRLQPLLPTQFLDQLTEVTTSFNFLINTVLLLHVITLELLVTAVYYLSYERLLGAVISMFISYLLYQMAISVAIEWGFVVNTAFDLFRTDLLRKFGFKPPKTIKEEKDLWRKIYLFLMYGEAENLDFDWGDSGKKEISLTIKRQRP